MATGTVIYKCSCGAYHPWAFDGDCRDDDNRYSSPEEYAEENSLDPDDIEVRAIDAEDDEVDDGEDDETDEDDDDEDEDDEDDDDGDDDDDQDEDEVSEKLSGAARSGADVCELEPGLRATGF